MHRLKSKKAKFALGFLIVFFVLLAIIGKFRDNSISNIAPPGKIITSSPINLQQTRAISVFRGCVGHDYSGYNLNAQEESLRTMKHYIEPLEEYFDTLGEIEIYAPFDGKITNIDSDQTSGFPTRGEQIWLGPENIDNWYVVFFHIDLLKGINKGSKVKSGQLIGYANMSQGAANYDISMKGSLPFVGPNIIVSPFDYMTDEVLEKYKDAGFELAKASHSKEYRDSNPCPIKPGTESKNDTFFLNYDTTEDWVNFNTK